MIKISFWLKKLDTEKSSLEYITIDNPKKVLEGKLVGLYACEVYVPIPELERKSHLIYSANPIDVVCLASEFVKSQLQFLINRGSCTIRETENGELWKLEKKDPQVYLREKIEKIKNNKNISAEEKQKILNVLKESFGKTAIGDQLKKAIDKI